jgi:hypothetical protein
MTQLILSIIVGGALWSVLWLFGKLNQDVDQQQISKEDGV